MEVKGYEIVFGLELTHVEEKLTWVVVSLLLFCGSLRSAQVTWFVLTPVVPEQIASPTVVQLPSVL